MRPKNNCMDCPDRKVGCHSTCESYKRFREELTVQNESIHKYKVSQQTLQEFFKNKYKRLGNK